MRSPITRANRHLPSHRSAPSINEKCNYRWIQRALRPPLNRLICVYTRASLRIISLNSQKTRLLLNETKKKHRARVYDEYTSKLYVVAIVQRFEQVIADNRRGKKRDANFFDDITQPLRNFQLLFFFFSFLFAIILSDCYCNPNLCVCWKTEGNRSTYINKI